MRILLLLALASTAQAQRSLTLDDAIALGRRQSRDLAAARARLDQAATSVTQAWVALLPTAAMQGKYTHNYKEVSLRFAQDPELNALIEILKATSGNAYRVSDASGTYNLKAPGSGGAGTISPSTLEASTVDLVAKRQ